MTLVGDAQREQTVAQLRRSYVAGDLDEKELARRTDDVLEAQTTDELHAALAGLPWEADAAKRVGRDVAASILALVWLWGIGSAVLLSLFGLSLARGASALVAGGFVTGWLVFTCALSLVAIRRLQRRPAS